MTPTAEEYRLRTQGIKQDRVTNTYSTLQEILPNYLEKLIRFPFQFKVKVYVVFDDQSAQRHGKEEARSYGRYLKSTLSGKDCPVSSVDVNPNITIVKVENSPFNRDFLKEFLHFVVAPRAFQFSEACSIIPVDQSDEPFTNLSLVYTDGFHQKYLPKLHGVSVFPSPKSAYIGRSTIFEELTYYSGTEKELIKKLLLQIFDPTLNMGVYQLLSAECKGRLFAHEKLVPPAKEIRQHWRINVNGKYVDAEYHPKIFEQMIIKDDAFSFYPSVRQALEFKGKKLEVQNRLIVEVDPHTSSVEYAGKVFDVLTSAATRLGLPIRRFHSGSSSARIHVEVDAENVLDKTSYLLDEYPFIGCGLKKRRGNIETDYKAIIGALKDAIFLTTYSYSYKEHPPKITKNKFNYDYNTALIDFPSDSIGVGSPKKIKRLDAKSREILRKINQDNPNWNSWENLPFTINMCTPLLDDEKAPKSDDEILSLSNTLSATEKINQNFMTLKGRMDKKVTTDTIETVLKRISEEQFQNLHYLSEENFRKKYH